MGGRLQGLLGVDGWFGSTWLEAAHWSDHGAVAAAWWLALGMIAGAAIQRTHFCTMGGIADALLMRSLHRLRAWAAAVAVMALAAAGLLAAGANLPAPSTPGLVAALAGGTAIGFGMVLSGGCLSRNLVRLGSLSLRAAMVVLVVAVASLVVTTGPLGPLAESLRRLLPLAAATTDPLGPIALAVGTAAFALWGDSRVRARRDLLGGLVLGLVGAGALLGATSSAPGLNPMLATETAAAGLVGAGPALPFAALPLGVVLGAALAADRAMRVDTFAGVPDTVRQLSGALLMGLGGGLVGGCTLGHGIVGVALAAPASLAVTFGMLAGAAWALRYLETGGLLRGLAALLPGRTA